ncbi:hypothetical protein THDSLph1_CDS0024 [Terrisporobacter phage TPDSL_ph1]
MYYILINHINHLLMIFIITLPNYNFNLFHKSDNLLYHVRF